MPFPLGGLRPPKNARALKFASYHAVASEAYPAVNYLDQFTPQGIDGNDREGDCVAVDGWAQARALITSVLTGSEYNAPMELVIKLYRTQNPDFDPNGDATTGPGSPADGGMDIQTMLEYLVSLGAGSEYGQLLGFARVDHTSAAELKAAVSVFGAVVVGEHVTDTQQREFPGEWTWDAAGANDGLHCVLFGGHQDDGSFNQATWGTTNKVNAEYVASALTEAWVCIWAEYLGSHEFMAGMDLAAFASDYTTITGRPFPAHVAPDPAPAPAPAPEPAPSPVPPPTPTPEPSVSPNPPVITSPPNGSVLTSSTVSVSGTSDSDGSIVIYDGPTTVGTATATGGTFSATLSLFDGVHVLSACVTDGAGATSEWGPAVDVSVQTAPSPTPPPPAPDPTPAPAPSPDPTPAPTPTPDVIPDVPVIESPVDGDAIVGAVHVVGTGVNADTVEVYDNGQLISINPSVISDDQWSADFNLEPGTHVLSAVERNSFGNVSDPTDDITVTVEAVPPAPPVDDVDGHFAHFLRHRVLESSRLGWELYADLRHHAEKWLDGKNL